MKQKKAMVLGGTPDHIELINLLKKKGFFVVLVDYYENPPAKNSSDKHIQESTTDKDLILRLAQEERVELVIATCVESALPTVAYVSEKLKLPCHISYDTALSLTNKALMKNIFTHNDIDTTKHVTVTELTDLARKTSELKLPIVVKPADANSSKGVLKVGHRDMLEKAVQEALSISRAKQVVIEEFFDGEELSVDVIITDYQPKILMATKMVKTPVNPNNFTIVQNIYPATRDEKLLKKIESTIAKIVKAYQIKEGPLLVQLLNNGNEIRILEFSARIGGGSKHSFLKRMTNFNAVEYFISVILREDYVVRPSLIDGYGAMNYIYSHPGKIKEFIGFEEILNLGIAEEVFYYKTEGAEIYDSVTSGDRPAGFMVVDDNFDNLLRRIREADGKTKILDIGNRDIKIYGLFDEQKSVSKLGLAK